MNVKLVLVTLFLTSVFANDSSQSVKEIIALVEDKAGEGGYLIIGGGVVGNSLEGGKLNDKKIAKLGCKLDEHALKTLKMDSDEKVSVTFSVAGKPKTIDLSFKENEKEDQLHTEFLNSYILGDDTPGNAYMTLFEKPCKVNAVIIANDGDVVYGQEIEGDNIKGVFDENAEYKNTKSCFYSLENLKFLVAGDTDKLVEIKQKLDKHADANTWYSEQNNESSFCFVEIKVVVDDENPGVIKVV